jgi:hypothetical protein
MPYEDSIQHLLVLFLEYKLARSPRERSRLEAEILQLFDTLGASLTPQMLSVRGEFERMRAIPDRPDSNERQLRRAATRFYKDRLSRFQSIPDIPDLSWGAKELLRIPIIEAFESAEFHNAAATDQSLRIVAESLREEPHSQSEGHGSLRTSIAVIRAYARNFCNIPPFCSGRNHE